MVYVWLGLCDVDVPVSPNVQDQFVGEFDEVSVKATASGAAPLVGLAVKLATGAGVTTVNVALLLVTALMTVPTESVTTTE